MPTILRGAKKMENDVYVGWFMLAVIISGLASALNRNRIIWLIFGLIAAPIALCVLVFLGKSRHYGAD